MVRERRWIGERERKIKYRVRKDINGMHGRKAEKKKTEGKTRESERQQKNRQQERSKDFSLARKRERDRNEEMERLKDTHK